MNAPRKPSRSQRQRGSGHRASRRKPERSRRLLLETLENRRVLSGLPQLLEVHPGATGSAPQDLVNVNGTLFFTANDGTNGVELWKSDGTVGGTILVANIRAGSEGSNPFDLTNVNGTLFFTANDGTSGYRLWKSDGTEGGTVPIGVDGAVPSNLTNVNGTLFFRANDGVTGFELWKSDGTTAGTVLVSNIRAGVAGSYPTRFNNVNGTLFFSANDGTAGYELWKSDGTAGGTVRVADIRNGSEGSLPYDLTNVNGTLFFTANDGTSGRELWKSDGSTSGTVRVADIRGGSTGSIGSYPYLTNVNGTLFFGAHDGTTGYELWKSDGTEAGTVRVSDINTGGDSYPEALSNVNGVLFFSANDGASGYELWKSDGTRAGTVRVADINPSGNSYPFFLTNVNGTFYFSAEDGTTGRELWQSDGTPAGTVRAADLNPTGSSYPQQLTNVNGALFFHAIDGTHGQELWTFSDPEAPRVAAPAAPLNAQFLKDIRPGTTGSDPYLFTNVNGTLFFNAHDGTSGPELWKTDGTRAGTVLVKDILPGSNGSFPYSLINVNGTLFFSANDGTHGYGLWKSDGTEAGTMLVKDGVAPDVPVNVNGTLFFRGGGELWKSDGTTAGTVLVKDIFPGGNSYPRELTNVNGRLFFRANDGVNGYELWTSDGTNAGTAMVKNINSSAGSFPSSLTNVGGALFFVAADGVSGAELWKSDGTTAGTVLVKDVNPGAGGSSSFWLTNVNGTLFFAANDGTRIALWKADGTEAGTVRVADAPVGSGGPRDLINVNGTLYFALLNTGGVWKSDGTESGTVEISGYFPKSRTLTNVNGRLFFASDDQVWTSDGTASGTAPVSTAYIDPNFLTNANGTLFFRASKENGSTGFELWKLAPSPVVISTADDGPGTLRRAIEDANDQLGAQTITFDIFRGTVHTIAPQSALPTITDPVVIDGWSQPGFAGTPVIELDGTDAGPIANGLNIAAGPSTVQGLAINRFGNVGITLFTIAPGNTIRGNHLGTDTTGLVALGNQFHGLEIFGADNVIGGTGPGDRNIISGNLVSGISMSLAGATNNLVQGNYIGVNALGTGTPAPNGAVGWWMAEGNASDAVGGNDGTLVNGATFGAGQAGQGFRFDGVDDFVSVPDSDSLDFGTGDFTIEFWVNFNDLANGSNGLVYKDTFDGDVQNMTGIVLNIHDGAGGVGLETRHRVGGDGPNTHARYATSNFQTGTWYHLAGVRESNVLSLYVDGVLRAMAPESSPTDVSTNTDLLIGALSSANPQFFDGSLDELAIYKRALSPAEIARIHAVGGAGKGAGNLGSGVGLVTDVTNNTIGGDVPAERNVISGNDRGVVISGATATGNTIAGNYIGTDATGLIDVGNFLEGIRFDNGTTGNAIGGTTAGTGNVISGNNGQGIVFFSAGANNLIAGNIVGLGSDGTTIIRNNQEGISLAGSSGTTIGGTTLAARNIISGNVFDGIALTFGSSSTLVVGNYLGTDVTGTLDRGNGNSGILIAHDSDDNTVGGTTEAERNVISGNNFTGAVHIVGSHDNTVSGNFIGTSADGTSALGNHIGVQIEGGSTGNTIGGTSPGARNVISANSDGVVVSGAGTTGNVVLGNLIGVDGRSAPSDATAWWRAENDAADFYGANTGSLVNGGFVNGKVGRAFSFDGDDYVSVPYTAAVVPGTGSFTAELWVQTTLTNAPIIEQYECGGSCGPGAGGSWSISVFGGRVNTGMRDSGLSAQDLTGSTLINDGAFHHVAMVRDLARGRFELYVDGVLEAQAPLTVTGNVGDADGENDPLTIGYHRPPSVNAGDASFFTGLVDEPTLYSRALSAAEIATIHAMDSAGKAGFADLGNAGSGVAITGGATGNTIGGTVTGAGNVISGNASGGVVLTGETTASNVIQGNIVGLDAAGTAALGNAESGIRLASAGSGNVIGGSASGARNVISGNLAGSNSGAGISNADTAGTIIQGNYIGLNRAGDATIGNQHYGIASSGGPALIGTDGDGTNDATEGNVIAGNGLAGIALGGSSNATENVIIAGNFIGTNPAGTVALGGHSTAGIYLHPNGGVNVRFNRIGTDANGTSDSLERNIISGNAADGVLINGSTATNNTVAGNLIGVDGRSSPDDAVSWWRGEDAAQATDFYGVNTGAFQNGATIAANGQVGSALSFNGVDAGVVIANNGSLSPGAGDFTIEAWIKTSADYSGTIGVILHNYGGVGLSSYDLKVDSQNHAAVHFRDTAGNELLFSGTSLLNDGQWHHVVGLRRGTSASIFVDGALEATQSNPSFGSILSTCAYAKIGGTYTNAGSCSSADTSEANFNGLIDELTFYNRALSVTEIATIVAMDSAGKAGFTDMGNGIVGVRVLNAPDNTVGGTVGAARNIVSGNAEEGIQILGTTATGNVVLGNYVGTDASGMLAIPNGSFGVAVGDAINNTVGGAVSGARNVISGNARDGIAIGGVFQADTAVVGNYVGLAADGTTLLSNALNGIIVDCGTGTVIDGNVVSGNHGHGITLTNCATDTLVTNNLVGTDASGTLDRGNTSDGVRIENGSHNNTIGGASPSARNIISGNDGDGIGIIGGGTTGNVVVGNYIGTDVGSGNCATGTCYDFNTDVAQADLATAFPGSDADFGGGTISVFGGRMHFSNAGASSPFRQEFDLPDNGATQGAFVAEARMGSVTPSGGEYALGFRFGQNNIVFHPGYPGGALRVDGPGGFGNVDMGFTPAENTLHGLRFEGDGAGTFTIKFFNANSPTPSFTTSFTNPGSVGGIVGFLRYGSIGGEEVFDDVSLTRVETVALGNGDNGILISAGATNNTIGGAAAGDGNVISGNASYGIKLEASSNTVQGNYIGTNATGTAPVANASGIGVFGLSNLIGTNGDGNDDGGERNVISGNPNYGVLIIGGGENRIAGNYIGTDATGTAAVAGSNQGVALFSTSGNIVGTDGSNDAFNVNERNIISGHANRAVILDGDNVVAGNYIGLDVTGTVAIGNFTGIQVTGIGARVGTNSDGIADDIERNVISGSSGPDGGIILRDATTTGAVVAGNYIGTNAAGTAALGNNTAGIQIVLGAHGNTIGGTTPGARNVISGNVNGVTIAGSGTTDNVVLGNLIGVDGRSSPNGAVSWWRGEDAAQATDFYGVNTGTFQNGVTIAADGKVGSTLSFNGIDAGVVVANNGTLSPGAGDFTIEAWIKTSAATGGVILMNYGGVGLSNYNLVVDTQGHAGVHFRDTAGNELLFSGTSLLNDAQWHHVVGLRKGASASIFVDGVLEATQSNPSFGSILSTCAYAKIGGTYTGGGNCSSANTSEGNFDGLIDELTFYNRALSATEIAAIHAMDSAGKTGFTDLGNAERGVWISNGASGNTIGGNSIGARNIISGNDVLGVDSLSAGAGTLIQGNYFGVDAAGTFPLPNYSTGNNALDIYGAGTIGGLTTTPGTGAGNLFGGTVQLLGTSTVLGNTFGLQADGTTILDVAVPATLASSGIRSEAAGSTIGGTAAGSRNVFAGHGSANFNGNSYLDILGGGTNTVQGNYFGTDITGLLNRNPGGIRGIQTAFGASGNIVGGPTAAARNVIVGGSRGFETYDTDNTFEGNYVGIAADGVTAYGMSEVGVFIRDNNNTIRGNVISGSSTTVGLRLEDTTTGSIVVGNFIGTDASGRLARPNLIGISVGTSGNTIGGLTGADRNVISGNTSDGIRIEGPSATDNIVLGNYIGPSVDGAATMPGIVSWYKGEGNANDSVGANHGTLVNGTVLTTGRVGQAFAFDGADDRVSTPLVVDYTHGVTFELWFKTSDTTPSMLMAGGGGATSSQGMGLFIESGGLLFLMGSKGTNGTANFQLLGPNVADGAFHHVAATWTGDTTAGGVNLYLDGVLMGTATASAAITTDGTALYLGSHPSFYAAYQGLIDEPTVFGRTLSSSEVQSIYNRGSAGKTGPLGNGGSGVVIAGGAADNTIGGNTAGARNVIGGNAGDGVLITGAGSSDNRVVGNFIGTNADGSGGLGNGSGYSDAGVFVSSGADHNTIGGIDPGAGNVISGNVGGGIRINGNDAVVRGNYIGTDAAGTSALGNGYVGIWVDGGRHAIIGGGMTGARNIISGNLNDGIYGSSVNGRIQGNYIGTDVSGNTLLSNQGQGAVQVGGDGLVIGVDGDGADDSREGNVIAGSGHAIDVGDYTVSNIVVAGNIVGLDASGTSYLGAGPARVFYQWSDTTVRFGTNADGVSDTLERNLFASGLRLGGGVNHIVAGNYFGTDLTGLHALGDGSTVIVTNGVRYGTNADGIRDDLERNVVGGAGSSDDLSIYGSNNIIAGNYFGLGPDGTTVIGTHAADGVYGGSIYLLGYTAGYTTTGNVIGGYAQAARNVIAGRPNGAGITLRYDYTYANTVVGNYIGTDATGTAIRENAVGVSIEHGSHDNTIGGTVAGAANVISGNTVAGVKFISGAAGTNVAGVLLSGAPVAGNVVAGNLIGTSESGLTALANGVGVLIDSNATNNTIGGASGAARNVISGNSAGGLFITGAHQNSVLGNFIGTKVGGSAALPNNGPGVRVSGDSAGNIIGGYAVGQGNLISGNQGDGILLTDHVDGTIVAGNLIGTDVTGTADLGNTGVGVRLASGFFDGAQHVTIGGDDDDDGDLDGAISSRNTISGNDQGGIRIEGFIAGTNTIAGNFIGVDANGILGLANTGSGVAIVGSSFNTIGGTTPGAGNRIALNSADGVRVDNGGSLESAIGGNAIRHNAIHSNGGLGINLLDPFVVNDGATANDLGDLDFGPNGLQNFPVFTAVGAGSQTRFVGTLHGAANGTFELDFFGNVIADSSGFGEGQRYLGSTTVTTDGSGDAAFNVLLNVVTFQDDLVTATATDATLKNTSEFSAAFAAVANEPPSISAGNIVITIVDPATLGESAGYGIPTTVIDEGDLIHLDGLFTNADANDVHTITVNWGDGSPVTTISGVAAGVRGFSTQHLYRDDDPTNTDHDVYRLEIIVTDQDGGSGRATIDLTVNNRPATLDSLSVNVASALEGDLIRLAGNFTDPGNDFHSLVITWGDGSPDQTVALPRGARSFSIPHSLLEDDDLGLGETRIHVRLLDDDGAQVEAETALNVDNVAPTFVINSLTPLPVVDELARFQASISDPGTRDTHALEWQAFVDGSPIPVAGGIGTSFEFTPRLVGGYHVTLSGSDDDGGFSAAVPFTLFAANAPPRLVASDLVLINELGAAITGVQEDERFFLSGSFHDSLLETHGVTINWNDGTPLETIALPAGELAFGPIPHRFADDNPTGTSIDLATIQVTVVDQYDATAQAARDLNVSNVAPQVLIVDDSSNASMICLKALVTDPGADSFTYAWRVLLLDGTVYDPGVPLTTTHLAFTRPTTGPAAGPLRVEFTATDDDLGTDSDTITLVTGTDAGETVSVTAVGQALTISVGNTTFTNVSADNRLLIEALGGDDIVTIGNSVMTPVRVDGGTGSDSITGGGGGDELSDGDTAEEGDAEFVDTLVGGDGDDTIISLAGSDVLDGGLGNETYGIVLHSDKTLIDNGGVDTIDFSRTIRSTTQPTGGSFGIAFDLGREGFFQSVDGFGSRVSLSGTFENVVGTKFNDVLAGNAESNLLFGGVGNDTLGGGVAPGVATGGTETPPGILGGNDTVDGGDGDDLIFGGLGSESLAGGVGNDTVVGGTATGGTDMVAGGDGDDLIFAGIGLESIVGGAGNDTIRGAGGTLGTEAVGGAGGNDMLDGGDGNDLIFAGVGDQSIAGGVGNDTIVGGAATGGMDTVTGGDGDDLIFAGTGLESIAGGAGNDTIGGPTQPGIVVPAGGGNDTIDGGDGDDLIFAGTGNDSLIGGAGGDTLVGGNNSSRQDTIIGDDGDDLIFAGTGNDSIVGGAGHDTINAATAPAGVVVPARGGNDSVDGGDGNDLIFAGTGNDTLVGGAGSDTLVGGNNASQQDSLLGGDGGDLIFAGLGNDTIVGGAGNDTINAATAPAGVVVPGRGGNDLVDGGDGNDLIFAGTGNDTLVGGAGSDTLVGGSNPARQDSILGGDGGDLIFAGTGNDTIVGGAGHDTINAATAPAGVNVPVRGGNDSVDGGDGNDLIFGGTGLDTIAGGAGNDTITASQSGANVVADDGDDLIFAGLGNDTIVGGIGHDTIRGAGGTLGGQPAGVAGGNDSLVGGDGDDLIFAGVGIDTIAGGLGNDTVVGGTGSASIAAGDGNDLIFAGLGNDTIAGGVGNDTIRGGGGTLGGGPAGVAGGNDSLAGDDGDDLIFAGVGSDTIAGGLGNDTLVGGAGSASIAAGDGNDLIFAGLGNDTIAGGLGNDTIQGGGGTLGGQTVGGATGHDTLLGEDGDDLIFGGVGNASIAGGAGNDAIHTGSGNSTAVGGAGSDTIQAGLGTELIFGGEMNGADEPAAIDQLIAVFDGSIVLDAASLTIGTVASQQQGFETAVLIGGDGPNTLDASAFTGQSMLVGGPGNDTLVAGAGNDTLEGGAGADQMTGGTGEDTYVFASDAAGDDTVVEGASNSGDTLDFSQFTAGVSIDLSRGTRQTIDAAGRLTLSGLANVENAFGSPFDDILLGNARDNELAGQGGRDFLDGGLGNDLVAADATRVVWLDFDSATNNAPTIEPEHVYTAAERTAIEQRIREDFALFNVLVTPTQPTVGPYIVVRFNDTPVIGGRLQPGGLAERVDFRGLDRSGVVKVDVTGFLGTKTNRLPPTSENFIALSSTITAHELGHMYGLRHHDAFGATLDGQQVDGIFRGTNPNQFNPVFAGPTTAETTRGHLLASPASVGTTLADALGDPKFGEREALKLAFMESGEVAQESDGKSDSIVIGGRQFAAQPLGELTSLSVAGVAARAVDVLGAIQLEATSSGQRSESDFYSFTGRAGERVTVEVMSQVLRQRIENPIDSMLRLYDSQGQKLGYFQSPLGAFNDDGLEPTDSLLLSVPLPADGTYYVEVDSFQFRSPEFATYQPNFDVNGFCAADPTNLGCTDQDTGAYELFLYSIQGGVASATGDTVLGGRGADRLVGTSGNETFDYVPEDGDTLSDPSGARTFFMGNHPPELAAIADPTANEGQTVTFTAAATDPEDDDLEYSLESVAGQTFPTGATIDAETGVFSWQAPDNGTFAVRVVATDPSGERDDQVVTITADNVPPTAGSDGPSFDENGAAGEISVLANDTDPAGANDPLSVTAIDTTETRGTVTLAGGRITYDPAGRFESLADGTTATDVFRYTITDGDGGSATGTVTVTIRGQNDGPDAVDDRVVTSRGVSTLIPVLANDVDVDGDALAVSIGAGPSQGTVTLNANGTFTYKAKGNAVGTDSFTYSVSDGHGGRDTATVRIVIEALHVFAQFPGSLPSGTATETIAFTVRASDFTFVSSKVLVGAWLKPSEGSSLDPDVVVIKTAAGAVVTPVVSSADTFTQVAASSRPSLWKGSVSLVSLSAGDYRATVKSQGGTSGGYRLDFFLAGDTNGADANGVRVVDTTDQNVINKDALNALSTQDRYVLEADVDLNGKVTSTDYQRWSANNRARTTLNPLFVTLGTQEELTAVGGVLRTTASQVTLTGKTLRGLSVGLDANNDGVFTDQTATANTSGAFSFTVNLSSGLNTFAVRTSDGFGQKRLATLRIERVAGGSGEGELLDDSLLELLARNWHS